MNIYFVKVLAQVDGDGYSIFYVDVGTDYRCESLQTILIFALHSKVI